MLTLTVFISDQTELIRLAHAIRTAVFIEEQSVSPELEIDGKDSLSVHYLAFQEHFAVGTARWRITGKGIKLERFAVLKAFRNKKIGEVLLTKILTDISFLKLPVYLNSQINAVSFYKRNGFKEAGEEFEEAGIKHIQMFYQL